MRSVITADNRACLILLFLFSVLSFVSCSCSPSWVRSCSPSPYPPECLELRSVAEIAKRYHETTTTVRAKLATCPDWTPAVCLTHEEDEVCHRELWRWEH